MYDLVIVNTVYTMTLLYFTERTPKYKKILEKISLLIKPSIEMRIFFHKYLTEWYPDVKCPLNNINKYIRSFHLFNTFLIHVFTLVPAQKIYK